MTTLSNVTLLERMNRSAQEPWQVLEVAPFDMRLLQPQSIDVELGSKIEVYTGAITDTRRDNSPWWEVLLPEPPETKDPAEPKRWVLQPERFYLGVLRQFIRIPEDCYGRLEGVSTRARDGIMIHQQAGLLDAGWLGWATCEITVANPHTILYEHQRIAQVTVTLLDRRADPAYQGRYQSDAGPQPARPDQLVALPGERGR